MFPVRSPPYTGLASAVLALLPGAPIQMLARIINVLFVLLGTVWTMGVAAVACAHLSAPWNLLAVLPGMAALAYGLFNIINE